MFIPHWLYVSSVFINFDVMYYKLGLKHYYYYFLVYFNKYYCLLKKMVNHLLCKFEIHKTSRIKRTTLILGPPGPKYDI